MAYDPFAPAPAGWYPREGDPPSVLRWWNGDHWTREVHGGSLSDGYQVRGLVDGHEWERAPFVPNDPVPRARRLPAAAVREPKVRATKPVSRRTAGIVAGVVGAIVVAVAVYSGSYATGTQSAESLAVGSCVNLSAPALTPGKDNVSWTTDDCHTMAGGPVSYLVTERFAGDASCGRSRDIQFFATNVNGKKGGIESTYCLMENLTVGECVYFDTADFEFDVACTDTRAVVKVTKRVEQASGVSCAPTETLMTYAPPGRTYCLAKP